MYRLHSCTWWPGHFTGGLYFVISSNLVLIPLLCRYHCPSRASEETWVGQLASSLQNLYIVEWKSVPWSCKFSYNHFSSVPLSCILCVIQVWRPKSLLNISIRNQIRNSLTCWEPIYLARVCTQITTSFPLLPYVKHLPFPFGRLAVLLFQYCWTTGRSLLPSRSCHKAVNQKKCWNLKWDYLTPGLPGRFYSNETWRSRIWGSWPHTGAQGHK